MIDECAVPVLVLGCHITEPPIELVKLIASFVFEASNGRLQRQDAVGILIKRQQHVTVRTKSRTAQVRQNWYRGSTQRLKKKQTSKKKEARQDVLEGRNE